MGKKAPGNSKKHRLRETGTANPHPERVKDTLFLEREFFDGDDLIQVKYEMLRRVDQEDWSVSKVASVFGFSRPSFYQARSAFKQSGIEGLIPQRRGPKQAHKLSAEIMDFVTAGITKDKSITSSELVQLIMARFNVKVHRRSLERAIIRQKKKKRREHND